MMVAIIILCAAIVLAFSVLNVISLKREQHEVMKQAEALQQEKAQLEKELSEINDPKNIEEQARDQLRLIMPGETLYMFPEEITKAGGGAAESDEEAAQEE